MQAQQQPRTWKEMQERYLQRVMGPGKDGAQYTNGLRRRDLRKFKTPARTPMEVAVSTAELSVAEREEAEEAKQSVEDLRKQVWRRAVVERLSSGLTRTDSDCRSGRSGPRRRACRRRRSG
jgi:hypothetical protein